MIKIKPSGLFSKEKHQKHEFYLKYAEEEEEKRKKKKNENKIRK